MAPSGINDSFREVMAAVRTWYEDAEWINDGKTKTYVSATSFKISGEDVTTAYHVGRRVRVVAATPGTIYGTITASSFSTDTTLTVSFDSGSLSNEAITSVSYGIKSFSNQAVGVANGFAVSENLSGHGEDSTNEKLAMLDVDWDPLSDWDSDEYRYTPSVSGRYVIRCVLTFSGVVADGKSITYVQKNGEPGTGTTLAKTIENSRTDGTSNHSHSIVTPPISLNGTTDYIEIWISTTFHTPPSSTFVININFSAERLIGI